MVTIDAKYLDGLSFSGSKTVKVKKDGAEKTEYQKFTRDATADDVLSFADKGDTVVIVMKDGKKYEVSKSKKKAKE